MEDFIAELIKRPKSKAILCNLIDGYESEVIEGKLIKPFLLFWWEVTKVLENTIDLLEDNADSILTRSLAAILSSPDEWSKSWVSNYPALFNLGKKPDFILCRLRTSTKRTNNPMARVTTMGDFFAFLSSDEQDDQFMNVVNLPIIANGKIIANIEGENKCAKINRIRKDTYLSKRGSVFWYAPMNKVAGYMNDADSLRDFLGLIHIKCDKDLILIEFHFANKCICGRPSVFEACTNTRFRNTPDGVVAKKLKSWGHCVDLKKFTKGNRAFINGSPERICESIQTGSITNINIHYVGRTKTTRGTMSNDDDDAFSTRLAKKRSDLDIKTQVINLL